jgi:hypothetical protein
VSYLTSICQVALGDMNELLNADYNANNLPKGKLRSVTDAISFDYSTFFSPPKSFSICIPLANF